MNALIQKILFPAVSGAAKCVPYTSNEPARPVADDSILKLIFSIDPNTGLPSSDLTRGLQNITNPEVANYIRERLQSPVTGQSSSPDDDVNIALCYHRGETRDEYIARLTDYFDIAKSDVERAKWLQEHTPVSNEKDKVTNPKSD